MLPVPEGIEYIRESADARAFPATAKVNDVMKSKKDWTMYAASRPPGVSTPFQDTQYIAASSIYRHQFEDTKWDRPGKEWYNYTYFPAVFRGEEKDSLPIAKPFMVIYSCQKPTNNTAIGHLPIWKEITVLATGKNIFLDVSMVANRDAQLAIMSAINFARPAEGSAIFFTRAWVPGYEAAEGMVGGPSLGLAIAACIMGGPRVAYTGFTKNIVTAVADNTGNSLTSQPWSTVDRVYNKTTGRIDAVTKLSDVIEDVQELGPKMRWAVASNTILVIPRSSRMGIDIETLVSTDKFARSWLLKPSAFFMFSTAQLNAGVSYQSYGSKILTVSTVSDAILLAAIAYTYHNQVTYKQGAKSFATNPILEKSGRLRASLLSQARKNLKPAYAKLKTEKATAKAMPRGQERKDAYQTAIDEYKTTMKAQKAARLARTKSTAKGRKLLATREMNKNNRQRFLAGLNGAFPFVATKPRSTINTVLESLNLPRMPAVKRTKARRVVVEDPTVATLMRMLQAAEEEDREQSMAPPPTISSTGVDGEDDDEEDDSEFETVPTTKKPAKKKTPFGEYRTQLGPRAMGLDLQGAKLRREKREKEAAKTRRLVTEMARYRTTSGEVPKITMGFNRAYEMLRPGIPPQLLKKNIDFLRSGKADIDWSIDELPEWSKLAEIADHMPPAMIEEYRLLASQLDDR